LGFFGKCSNNSIFLWSALFILATGFSKPCKRRIDDADCCPGPRNDPIIVVLVLKIALGPMVTPWLSQDR